METVLAPWLPVLDKFSPHWRRRLHGAEGKPRDVEFDAKQFRFKPLPTREEQLQLRESVELLAIALAIDVDAFVVAISGDQLDPKTSRSFKASERRLKIRFDASTSMLPTQGYFMDFISGWNERSSSVGFQDAKQSLLQLEKQSVVETPSRLDLSLFVLLDNLLVEWLQAVIDSDAFHVTYLNLNVFRADVDKARLLELFAVVETTNYDGVHVRVDVNVPEDGTSMGTLAQWKTLLDLVTRRRNTPVRKTKSTSGKWTLYVSCSEMDTHGDSLVDYLLDAAGTTYSDPRFVVACFSTLAHAAESVTSVDIYLPLDDDDVDSEVRTKSLAYVMLTGAVDKLSVRDKRWDADDVRWIAQMLRSKSRQDQLRQLWNEEWEDDKHTSIELCDAEYLLEDPSDLLGVVNIASGNQEGGKNDSEAETSNIESAPALNVAASHELIVSDGNSKVEIWLAGYGQCTLPRTLVESVLERQRLLQQRELQPKERHPLKEFSLRLTSIEQEQAPVIRVVELIGATLERLIIDVSSGSFPVSFLATILRACPQLQELSLMSVTTDSQSTFGCQLKLFRMRVTLSANSRYTLRMLACFLVSSPSCSAFVSDY